MNSQNSSAIKSIKSNTIITSDPTTKVKLSESMRKVPNIKKLISGIDRNTESNQSPCLVANGNRIGKIAEANRLQKHSTVNILKSEQTKEFHPISLSPIRQLSSKKQSLPKINKFEKLSMSAKLSNVEAIIPKGKSNLRFIELNEELNANYRILTEANDLNAKSWLEDIISIKDYKRNDENILDNLKFCNELMRNILLRLKISGNENECILLERVWEMMFEGIDNYICIIHKNIDKSDLVAQNTEKTHQEIEKIKLECQKKVSKLEKQIRRFKLEYILAKDPRKTIEAEKMRKISPYIYRITKNIEILLGLNSEKHRIVFHKRNSLPENLHSYHGLHFPENFTILEKEKELLGEMHTNLLLDF